jgi:cbb3-type cytochrome oxidase maturation protein
MRLVIRRFFFALYFCIIMSVVIVLLAASLSVALCFLAAFIWSVKTGQYDDDYTPSVRMLFDEKSVEPENAGHASTSLSVTDSTPTLRPTEEQFERALSVTDSTSIPCPTSRKLGIGRQTPDDPGKHVSTLHNITSRLNNTNAK